MAIQNTNLLSRTTRTNRAAKTDKPVDPRGKLWINVGVVANLPDADGNIVPTMVKMPLGIPATALNPAKVYANMNASYKARVQTMNDVIETLLTEMETLEPGESKVVGMSVEIYRAQEAEEEVYTPSKAAQSNLRDQLFGSFGEHDDEDEPA